MAVYEDPAGVLTALIRASHLSAFEDLPALVAAHAAARAWAGSVSSWPTCSKECCVN
ncbi:hypothetical protein [Streptomyces sp. WG5]|uniref:hypothetical protein n=1 Tax=Streptomyces sp. WG5 TaxID=3417648 RepID=UPI003CED2C34